LTGNIFSDNSGMAITPGFEAITFNKNRLLGAKIKTGIAKKALSIFQPFWFAVRYYYFT